MPRVLVWDIERAPHLAYTYGIWQQNISRAGLIQHGEMFCFAAKWLGEPGVEFHATWHGEVPYLRRARDLLNEATHVVSFMGTRFDTKHANNVFLRYEIPPPSPYKQIDLFRIGKQYFDLPFKGLDDLAQLLGLGGKLDHENLMLSTPKALAGDVYAQREIGAYNRQDVVVTEDVALELERRGWLELPR
jgi:hypothetical protein